MKNSSKSKGAKGLFIVLDGTDGSGKATQTRLLVEHLLGSGISVETIDFPRYKDNLLGKLIRECLDGLHGDFIAMDPKVASVLYAGDRHESRPLIQGWLDAGKVVIADRYVSSNQIHQGGKIRDEEARERFLAWLDELEFGAFKLPRPDMIVYLNVPVDVSMKMARDRAIAKGESPDKAEIDTKHQRESQESALSIVRRLNNWIKVDCAPEGKLLSPEAIHALVFKAIEHLL